MSTDGQVGSSFEMFGGKNRSHSKLNQLEPMKFQGAQTMENSPTVVSTSM